MIALLQAFLVPILISKTWREQLLVIKPNEKHPLTLENRAGAWNSDREI